MSPGERIRKSIMQRILPIVVVLVLLLSPAAATAQKKFGFDFVVTAEKTIRITDVDGKGLAGQIGLRQADIVKKIGDRDIRSKQDLDDALQKVSKGKEYKITIYRPRDRKEETFAGSIKQSRSGSYYVVPRR